jgi:hypothetical protein
MFNIVFELHPATQFTSHCFQACYWLRVCTYITVFLHVFWCREGFQGLTYALFWDVTQCWMVIVYRRLGTTYRSHLQGSVSLLLDFWTLEDGTDRLSWNVGTEYHSTLRNIPITAQITSSTSRRKREITISRDFADLECTFQWLTSVARIEYAPSWFSFRRLVMPTKNFVCYSIRLPRILLDTNLS